jgi:hypothetical protein
MILVLNKKGLTDARASELSIRISHMIRDRFNGNRQSALKEANRFWKRSIGINISRFPGQTTESRENWELLFLLLAGPKPSKKDWIMLTRLRFAGRETDFIKAWQDRRSVWAGSPGL